MLKKKTTEVNSVSEENTKEVVNDGSKVSSEKMKQFTDLLQKAFNLENKQFQLVGYADKGNKIVAVLANEDFDITFTLRSQKMINDLEG